MICRFMLKKLISLRKQCHQVETSLIYAMFNCIKYKIFGKNIVRSSNVKIYGLGNIATNGLLSIGLKYVGFTHRSDVTLIRANGKIIFDDNFSIGKGCRLDVGKNAIARFSSGYINANSLFVIMHGIEVGYDCAISWGCQFLDEDFHQVWHGEEPINTEKKNKIVIGDHVWIGSNVSVLKGAVIPDGCIVASGSIVNSQFTTKNALLAGVPARIVKNNVFWK